MKKILETIQLEFPKSIFLIDLVKNSDGLLYIEIVQTIIDSKYRDSSIKINPTVLPDIIKALQDFDAKITYKSGLKGKYMTDSEQLEIQKRYLKGVSIKDLATQFDQNVELIEMVLRNKHIEIVENKMPKPRFWAKNYKKRKE